MSIASSLARRALKQGLPAARRAAAASADRPAASVAASAVKALPAAKPPIALLPPAASVREVGRQVPWVEAGWQRHERHWDALASRSGGGRAREAAAAWLAAQREAGKARHNGMVLQTRQMLERQADGPIVRAASRDLGRVARAIDAPTQVVLESAEFIYQFIPFRPIFDRLALIERLGRSFDAVKRDPNSVRRWVKGLADTVPTFPL